MATEREKMIHLAQKVNSIREAEETVQLLLQELSGEEKIVWEMKRDRLRGIREYRDFLGDLQSEILMNSS